MKEKLIWGPLGPFKPYNLVPNWEDYLQRKAEESRSRFESAVRLVKHYAGTAENQCAMITVVTLFGIPALREAWSRNLWSPARWWGVDSDNFKEFLSKKVEELGLEEIACRRSDILQTLLLRADCVGGLALWALKRGKHVSPILPGPMTESELDVYYLDVNLRWPPYTRTNPYRLLAKTGEVKVFVGK